MIPAGGGSAAYTDPIVDQDGEDGECDDLFYCPECMDWTSGWHLVAHCGDEEWDEDYDDGEY